MPHRFDSNPTVSGKAARPGHHRSGQSRSHLEPAGNSTQLAGVGSNDEPVVLRKVPRQVAGSDFLQAATHLVMNGAHGVEAARKV
jgi:hypothetical protein